MPTEKKCAFMDDEPAFEEIRLPADVAYRGLALISVIGLAFGADRTEITDWLAEHELWGKFAPSEIAFIETPVPSPQQVTDAGWLSERLIVILWALGAIDELPPADKECDTAVFLNILPPYASISVSDFVAAARLRPASELIAMADQMLDLHWKARDAKINARHTRGHVDLGIIQERHHAANWLIGYEGLDWDDITTDT